MTGTAYVYGYRATARGCRKELEIAVSDLGGDSNGDFEASGAVAAHEASPDPHAVYLTEPEADAVYEPLGAVDAAIASHESDGDPHAQYLTEDEADALYDEAGAALAEVGTHEAASDPHTQYQRESEKAQASGYASLDGSTKVPFAQIPTGTGASEVAVGNHTHAGGADAFPVGSVFISVVSTNPATLLGYGTWSAFGAGRVLVGLDSGDADFDSVEETGGAKTVTSTGSVSAPTFTGSALGTHSHGAGTLVPNAHSGTAVADHASHTHSVTSNVTVADHASHTHTYTDVPNHTHPHNLQGNTTGTTTGTHVMGSAATGGSARAMGIATSNNTNGVATGTTNGPGATMTHIPTNNAVTSGNPSATLTHSVTQPSDHTMSGSSQAVSAGTPAGTNSAPTYTGNATSVVQPYIVCYFWKRTA